MVNVITSVDQFKQSIAQDKLVVVDFFATWCGPCKMIAPILEKFDKEYTNVDFFKLDVDELGSVAQEQEVSAMPTIIFYKNGSVVDKIIGANPNAIKQKLVSLSA
ncbi:Thioredoxin [Wickerhamomyces ciferrii]|uniref:Thioredoxin n=1 Tax=Wickerhamomyces ciferrii (strain ATCC 14091 / BCRC 22168 / CBS 111 / JCM 3599 / NBRC 0793 / NRRL Y-1031 F-60-10) TaxID=1206466 RepID=K0KI22_WICCF|nr:Thioredoxin [Wickerhamomyces ciferrii]CCH42666.1 Thioredoxin [Wickerhamomyces ciferrii]